MVRKFLGIALLVGLFLGLATVPSMTVAAEDGHSAADDARAKKWCADNGYKNSGNLTLGAKNYDAEFQACVNGFLNPTSTTICSNITSADRKAACKAAQRANTEGVDGAPSPRLSGTGSGGGGGCTSTFLTFPAWYDGLLDGDCKIASPSTLGSNGDGLTQFIFRIVLNIIEIVLQVIAYATAGYIIYGGFKYLTAAGSPDRVTAGRKIITNALVGLVISFMSIAIVNLISGNVGLNTAVAANCAATGANVTVDPNCVGVAKTDANDVVNGVLNTAYFAAGVTGVIVIIVSALFYVTSNGDASKTKRAKDGILYAVVGLVVVMVAFVITNFVIGRF